MISKKKEMIWCSSCGKRSEIKRDAVTNTYKYCVDCGKVVYYDPYVNIEDGGTTFVEIQSACSDSHTRTLNRGNDVIYDLIDTYRIFDVCHATKYYQMAVERGFTRRRKEGQVAAACLYVACREMKKPLLLIEFSSFLGVSVYELGTVYLQLCKLLSLQDNPFLQKPVDPSIFMHISTSVLMKDRNYKKVLNTALLLAVSMKTDWMQKGRKPSGICAAAIYVSLVLHGYKVSKTNVVKAVHICEATLMKRLIEFENSEAGSLTIEEFTQNAKGFEREMQSCKQSANAEDLEMPGKTEVVCEHKSSAVQSGFGLCKDCYMEFCGGIDGSEPPAFQHAEVERLSKESVKRLSEPTPQEAAYSENGTRDNANGIDNINPSTEVEGVALNSGKLDKTSDSVDAFESLKEALAHENGTLSDIDDFEFLQEQAAKEAAAVAARKLYTGTLEEIREVQALAACNKEKNKRKRELEAKPAENAAEAAGQYFKKKLGSKINYDMLTHIFGDEEPGPEKNCVDDGGDAKRKEITSEDNNDKDEDDECEDNSDDEFDELDYDYEQMSEGNDDDYYQDYYHNESWIF